ncbi:MAG TPA: non-homologous end-joining DNA ligase [Actinomycetota bacterium]|nr:non-homologous end-joining DNA ligase [Actinomycetota bacterium]
MAKPTVVNIEGRELKLTNLDKVLYPEAGFTKADVIDYYTKVSPVLLPHLRNRPLTLKRYPEGVNGDFFYEKNCPKYRPSWMRTIPVWSERQNKRIEFCSVDELAGLVWAANLADLELHTSLSDADHMLRPNAVAFDLDPGPATSIVECCELALALRRMFTDLGLEAYPKTSGSKGMQVYLPLNSDDTYDQSKAFAHAVAGLMEQQMPDLVVSDMKKELRHGKVLIDWSQNDFFKTTVCVYSLRAKQTPTVSTPLRWDEVEATAGSGDPEQLRFTYAQALDRVAEHGDLFAPVLTQQQTLPALQ